MNTGIKNGIMHGLAFFLTISFLSIGYAAITNIWTNTNTLEVNSSSVLTSSGWNSLLGNFEYLKSKTENIHSNGGNVGIGVENPLQKLSVAGTIESTAGGFKFPDGSVQTTANTPRYMFKANLGSSNLSITSAQIIPFSQEEYDVGNIYNNSTYTVTIPKSGYYEFCVNILGSVATTSLHYSINGLIPLGYQGATSWNTITGCDVRYYNIGSSVNIQTWTGDNGVIHHGNWSTFYGRFLY